MAGLLQRVATIHTLPSEIKYNSTLGFLVAFAVYHMDSMGPECSIVRKSYLELCGSVALQASRVIPSLGFSAHMLCGNCLTGILF